MTDFLDILHAVHAEWWQSEPLLHFHNTSCDKEYQMVVNYTDVPRDEHHTAWWAYMILDAKWLNTLPVLYVPRYSNITQHIDSISYVFVPKW